MSAFVTSHYYLCNEDSEATANLAHAVVAVLHNLHWRQMKIMKWQRCKSKCNLLCLLTISCAEKRVMHYCWRGRGRCHDYPGVHWPQGPKAYANRLRKHGSSKLLGKGPGGPLCIEINTLMEMRHFNAARPVHCSFFCSVTSTPVPAADCFSFKDLMKPSNFYWSSLLLCKHLTSLVKRRRRRNVGKQIKCMWLFPSFSHLHAGIALPKRWSKIFSGSKVPTAGDYAFVFWWSWSRYTGTKLQVLFYALLRDVF